MVFGDGQSNGVIKFYSGSSLVATATKFEISPRFLHLTRGFQSGANK